MPEQSAILESSTGWLLLILFSGVWISLGILWGRKAKTLDGYMLAGRNVGLALGSATAMATWVTSNTTMLAPQFALELGIWGMLAYSTASIGLFLFAPMAKRIKKLMPKGMTSGDFMRLRYGKAVWITFLFISIFYSVTWMISMAMAGGLLLKALAGIPYIYGMTIILVVCVVYTLVGGLYAVIGTDYIQSVIIVLGIVVVGFSVLMQIDIEAVYGYLEGNSPALISIFVPFSIMALFNNLLFGVGEIFHSNVWWSRAFAMSEGVGKKAYLLAGLFWLPIPVSAGFIALTGGVMGINVVRPDMIGPLVSANILGYFGAIVVFIVVFSSIASSIDSLLAATSDLITKDFYHKLFKPKAGEKELKSASAYIIVIIGIITWLICLPNIGTLAQVLFFAGPLVGSTIWPILAGLYWRKANSRAALIGMIAGITGGLIVYQTVGWYAASIVGTAISMIIVVAGRYISPDSFSWKNLDESQPEASRV